MIHFDDFFDALTGTDLQRFDTDFKNAIQQHFTERKIGDMPGWLQAFADMPELTAQQYQLDKDTVSIGGPDQLDADQRQQMETALQQLHPWRKGPFDLFGIHIDTEWRSDWKWQRVAPHISSLAGRQILDVGCGSGYHCWRMRGAGASLVVGIDPSPKFLVQFAMCKRYLPEEPVFLLPLTLEQTPATESFDTVFSMGVLYHRKSPFDHLEELKQSLRPGGELILETLVVDGDEHTVLLPPGRYAQMRNVWFLPSAKALCVWLEKIGFRNIRIVDDTITTTEEQRSTNWMRFHSLANFLDPQDASRTVEGLPAPRRATLIAER